MVVSVIHVAAQTIKHFKQRVDDRLSKRIGGLGDLIVGHVSGCERQVAALIGDDRSGSFNCPLREICAAPDRHRLGSEVIVGHLLFLLICRFMKKGCVEFCVRTLLKPLCADQPI